MFFENRKNRDLYFFPNDARRETTFPPRSVRRPDASPFGERPAVTPAAHRKQNTRLERLTRSPSHTRRLILSSRRRRRIAPRRFRGVAEDRRAERDVARYPAPELDRRRARPRRAIAVRADAHASRTPRRAVPRPARRVGAPRGDEARARGRLDRAGARAVARQAEPRAPHLRGPSGRVGPSGRIARPGRTPERVRLGEPRRARSRANRALDARDARSEPAAAAYYRPVSRRV